MKLSKPLLPLSVLVIDSDRAVRDRIAALEGLDVIAVDPSVDPLPDEGYAWRDVDVLVLANQFALPQSGVRSWLSNFRRRKDFPATVLVSPDDEPYRAVQALKLGVADYLKSDESTATYILDVLRCAKGDRDNKPKSGKLGATRWPDDDDPLLNSLRRYTLDRQIGSGTQSRIYRAKRKEDGLTVAVKILAVSTLIEDDVVTRFEREAEALDRIASPYVVRLLDHAFSGESGFLAMEYLPDGDLRSHVGKDIPLSQATEWIHSLLCGLDAIHSAGVLHRDLKPTNLMFRPDGSLVIADFGVSRLSDSTGEHTTEGMLLGTPAYMSPEQCMGLPVDERADLYSAGVIAYELITGRRPYVGRGVIETLKMHIDSPVPALPEHAKGLQPLIDTLMCKQLSQRVGSAAKALSLLAKL